MSSACGCHHEGPLIPSTCIANPVFGVSLSWHDSIILSRGVEWIASMGPRLRREWDFRIDLCLDLIVLWSHASAAYESDDIGHFDQMY